MIDTANEMVFDFRRAAKEIDRLRGGAGPDDGMERLRRKMSISTLYRWSKAGCRGVVLETIQVGTTRCTSREALQRFFERVSRATVGAPGGPSNSGDRSAADHARRGERAGKILEMLGV